MSSWPMQIRDDDGSISRVLIQAPSRGAAMQAANSKGYVIEWCADAPEDETPPTSEGMAMGKVADTMAAFSILVFPLSIPAMICGAVASDRSKGEHGATAIKLATITLCVWVFILCVIFMV